jgi:hypothetical protein
MGRKLGANGSFFSIFLFFLFALTRPLSYIHRFTSSYMNRMYALPFAHGESAKGWGLSLCVAPARDEGLRMAAEGCRRRAKIDRLL